MENPNTSMTGEVTGKPLRAFAAPVAPMRVGSQPMAC